MPRNFKLSRDHAKCLIKLETNLQLAMGSCQSSDNHHEIPDDQYIQKTMIVEKSSLKKPPVAQKPLRSFEEYINMLVSGFCSERECKLIIPNEIQRITLNILSQMRLFRFNIYSKGYDSAIKHDGAIF